MDLDLSFIKALLTQDGAFHQARHDGICGSMIHGDGVKLWDFIRDHFREYGEMPSETLVSAKTGIVFPEKADGIKTLISEMKGRKLYEQTHALNAKLVSILDGDKTNIQDVLPAIHSFLDSTYRSNVTGQKIGNLLSLGPDVWDLYVRIKNGERGIQAPWKAINDSTMGWWPGDFVVFVARASIGKTFALLQMARQAWMDGNKVLFIGTEMSRLTLAMRFFAIHFHIPYFDFRSGRLSTLVEQKSEEAIRLISSDEGIQVVGDDFDADIDVILSAVEQTKPDLVLVDGLYLVKNKGHDRQTKVSNTADDLKRAAKGLGIPIIVSTQFNREASGNSRSDVSLEKIGVSDVISWNGDVIYGMYRDEEMEQANEMGFKGLKIREGRKRDFVTNWNFQTMDFSQKDSGGTAPSTGELASQDGKDDDFLF